MLATIAILFSVAMANPLSSNVLQDLQAWQSCESLLRVRPGHGSTVQLVTGSDGKPQKTKTAVLIIPGLYNSPAQMKSLAEHFFAGGSNVVCLRLRGQYEVESTAMRSTVQWSEWKEQSEQALKLAESLGEKVLLVGHSTGALLLTWLAVEQPQQIAGLVLFAPAFAVHKLSRLSLRVLHKSGLVISNRDGFLVTGHAGLEVEKLAAAFARTAAPNAAAALQDVPIWMANTDLDFVVDRHKNLAFLKTLWPNTQSRVAYQIPASRRVLHGNITLVSTSAWQQMLESIGQTFF